MAVTINASTSAGLVQTADTSGVLALQTAGTTAVSISSGQVVTLTNALAEASGGTGTTVGYNGFKNRIINGAMVIDQRNAGASLTPTNGAYSLDRWQLNLAQASKFTVQQSSTVPTGFGNSLKITSSSAYSVVSTDYFALLQCIEAQNITDFSFGTANAKTVTLSFWVYSSLTGTFGGSARNYNADRSYPFSYSISSANTWEQKTVTFTGDTTGTWNTTGNSGGLFIIFSLGAGSTLSGTVNAWQAGNYIQPTGATSVVGTNGATLFITGVQLEKGSTATSFDYRPITTELALCQRYFEMTFPQGTAPVNGYTADLVQQGLGFWTSFSNTGMRSPIISFKVTKRAAPSITIYSSGNSSSGTFGFYNGTLATWTSISTNNVYAQDWGVGFNSVAASGATGTSYLMAGAWTASSEL